ncbi:MAG: cytochrome c3 family protein [Candidatus Marinimicrobia bacterium]|nr:cytochrome c3 family protein [Candidatus Neomarinimicrobiota bacterium]
MKFYLVTILLLLNLSVCFSQSDTKQIAVPDKIQIGLLENIFEPVQFDHKLHSEMTVMGDGCNTCHHHGSEGVYVPCADCHVTDEENASLSMPTINGAYHRNCLNCHQSWYGKKLCETCHTQKKRRFNLRNTLDATDILSHHHKEIIVPDLFHFVRPESQQKPVVFQHKEHVDLYRFKCEHCHLQTNCSTCHNYSPTPAAQVKTLPVHHNPCSKCHDTQTEKSCNECHRNTPSKGFTHAKTGWELSQFHQGLSCDKCHVGAEPIRALDKTCTGCHTNFELGEFDHQVTGIQLSEEHNELDCYECHSDDRYDVVPSCVECHDEDLSFPTDIPGTRIKLK